MAYDCSVDYLNLEAEDVLVSTVTLLFVLSYAGYKMGTLPSGSSASQPARTVFSIIDEDLYKGSKKEAMGGGFGIINYGKVEFKDATLRYAGGQRKTAFEKLSFEVPTRSIVGIVGNLNSGKSSIAKVLLGLYQPQDGSV